MDGVIGERLCALRDEGYRAFQCKLIPTVDPARVIGVRVPQLRALAKELRGNAQADAFLRALSHGSLDADILHALLISQIPDADACVEALDAFLPHVDNWATCDLISPRAFKKHPPRLLGDIRRWMASGETYTVRFGIGMLLQFYLDDAFDGAYLDWVAQVRSEEYYVKMMVAWYFATALDRQYAAALPYIEQERLEPWTHNKAIQKAIESRRIPQERKDALRALRVSSRKAGGKGA